MTQQEIKEALIEYAKEDTQIAIDNGMMSITDTKVGVIHVSYENGLFQASNGKYETLIENADRDKFSEWLIDQYAVEIG